MSEAANSQAANSQDEKPSRPKRWRDDPLSLFLIAAAILLGAMYAYDQWQTSRLDEQIARANQIAQSFAVDGADCGVSSTGLDGEVLVVHCAGLPATKVAAMAQSIAAAQRLDGFQEIVLRGADHQLACPVDSTGWPDACAEQKIPTVE